MIGLSIAAQPRRRRRYARPAAVGTGVLGLVMALALEADLVLTSGIWYPVVYAGAPTAAGLATFVHGRPTARARWLVALGVWLLVGSVLALALGVVLALASPRVTPVTPLEGLLSSALLYAGFVLVPVALAHIAASQRGLRAVLPVVLAPVGQAVVAALLIGTA